MKDFSKHLIHICYDFIENIIIKDYQHAIHHITPLINFSGNEILLDVGGGTWYVINSFAPSVKLAISLDPSRKMLQRSLSEKIDSLQADGINLPFKDESIDIVFLIHVIHHIHKNHHEILLKEIYRVLKSKGSCFILDLYYPMTFWNRVFTKIEETSVGKTYHVSADSLISHLKRIGYRHVTCTYTDPKKWRFLLQINK